MSAVGLGSGDGKYSEREQEVCDSRHHVDDDLEWPNADYAGCGAPNSERGDPGGRICE